MRIVWFDDALMDLDDIYEFRAQESERSAAKLYNKILDRPIGLTDQPSMGTIDPYLNDDAPVYRFLLVDKIYKIIYKVDTDEEIIYIFMVWNCRQNPEKIKEKTTGRK